MKLQATESAESICRGSSCFGPQKRREAIEWRCGLERRWATSAEAGQQHDQIASLSVTSEEWLCEVFEVQSKQRAPGGRRQRPLGLALGW